MAPVRRPKTYSRNTTTNYKYGQNVVDSLFTLNLDKGVTFKKKKRSTTRAKEVEATKDKVLLSDSSLQVTVNDTFDRLFKGEKCQPVVLKDVVKNFTSDSDITKSKNGLHLSSISLRTTIHSPIIRKRKKKKRRKSTTRVKDVADHKSTRQNRTLDRSVHYTFEIEKCNMSSLYRPNGITYNDCKAANSIPLEQHSESISFEVPKICSTPMAANIVPLKSPKRFNDNSEQNSPISTSKTRFALQQKKSLPLHENSAEDPKFSMVPYVRLDNYLPVLGVNTSVSLNSHRSNESDTDMTDNKENIHHRCQLIVNITKWDDSKFYVNKRKRRPKSLVNLDNISSKSLRTRKSDGSLSKLNSLDPNDKICSASKSETTNLFGEISDFKHSTPLKAHRVDAKSVSVKTQDASELISVSLNNTEERNRLDTSSDSCADKTTENSSSSEGKYFRYVYFGFLALIYWYQLRFLKYCLLVQFCCGISL